MIAMIKKITFSFLFFCLLEVLVVSCCEEEYNLYLTSINFTVEDNADFDITTIKYEDLQLNLFLTYETELTYLKKELSRLSNKAYATSCDETYIVRNKATQVEITSDATFQNIEAGNSLNEFFYLNHNETLKAVDSVLDYINQDTYYYGDFYQFVLANPINEDVSASFKISISLENGELIERSTVTTTITAE